MTTHENNQQPLLVTILASAISSVGYGVSLFAIAIIWLLPSIKPTAPIIVMPKHKPKHQRRRSAPPSLQSSLQRPLLPSLVSDDSKPSADSPRTSSGRVYFADSLIPSTPPVLGSRRHTAPPDSHKDRESFAALIGSRSMVPLDASPRSSSSTLVHAPAPPPPISPIASIRIPDANTKPESLESDTSMPSSTSSSKPSLLMSPRFPTNRIKTWGRGPAGGKNHQHTDAGGEATNSDEPAGSSARLTPVSRHKRKAASLGFSWPISKNKAISEPPASPKTPVDASSKQDCSCTPSSISSFVRSSKQQRRVSAPVQRARTQPYAYPYFALPPTMTGEQSVAVVYSVIASKDNGPVELCEGASSVGESETTMTADRQRQNNAAQASLGLGYTTISPKRVLSEGSALAS
ncbi:hypothetical protein J3R30DRAFT_3441903 [Lentinula aciculospora]|uniref:Uncharacterized protein n=1 Tax=Lentinula aciculospora TaxID=153920 RepID=A0A9W9DV70_9AGAR|nr:hypothetical protein J3R30DRAFT_3441903 [Lentinula aciculospora]